MQGAAQGKCCPCEADEEAAEAEDIEHLDESELKWSKAYMAVSALENLFESCDAT